MADLKTDYTDDVLNEHMNGKRRFKITHSDGTEEMVTIEDASSYLQTGSTYGAADVNKTNQRVNEHSKNLTASNGTPFRFAVDENGEYGHIVTDSEGADTFSPFKTDIKIDRYNFSGTRKSGESCSFHVYFDVAKHKKVTFEKISLTNCNMTLFGYISGVSKHLQTLESGKGSSFSEKVYDLTNFDQLYISIITPDTTSNLNYYAQITNMVIS